jgi:(1->4)-alpha-D-glucan 1-alpha-D-glucosylmutase
MPAPSPPHATYRLQFSRDFSFRDAERLVPYLHALGVSHIYASPYLKARAGSSHGYDITDYNALNPEIGDAADFDAMVAALVRHDMGQILDIVPNHMGIGRADNAWWLDVLEWGQSSPYADYFDIGWNAPNPHLQDKLLLPILGDHYGAILEAAELLPAFDAQEGSFSVWYHEHRFPLAPRTYPAILAAASGGEKLASLAAAFRQLPRATAGKRTRAAMRARAGELKRELACAAAAEPELCAAIDRALQHLRGVSGDPSSFLPLHRLLERQHYRLAYWRVAADEINYRRFFDINELAGVRMERAEVFETAHRLVLQLFAEGKIDGVRIDHIDGLSDPLQYCTRLRQRMSEACGGRVWPYLLVEKILAQHEALRSEWPIDGGTGYRALNLINGLFVDGRAERAIDRAYGRFIGRHVDFDAVLYDCKKHVMDTMLAGELQVLAVALDAISEANWRTRDFTLTSLKAVIREVVACFPVYRTYVTERGAGTEDRRDIDWAVALARRRSQSRETTIFDFIHGALTTDIARKRPRTFNRRAVIEFAMKFQQFTGPVTAKAMEDTAFYRYTRLISLNEVGSDPRRFGTTVAAFHHLNQECAKLWPHTMVTTATHDTKRGEDVRARINALTEFPAEWGRRLRRWSTLNKGARSELDGAPAPSADDEYLLYQTLVGAWPMELAGPDEPAALPLERFRERIAAYMIKAVREAKQISNWTTPNIEYESILSAFVQRILDPSRSRAFFADLQAFSARIALPGMINSLAQAVLKLTIPGVPDIYQGCELWDLNLVDPDNRRPVDFSARAAALAGLPTVTDGADGKAATAVAALLDRWRNGRIKLHVQHALLAERRRRPSLFGEGGYVALSATGAQAEHIIAFARIKDAAAIAVAVPRLVASLGAGDGRMPIGDVWMEGALACPPMVAGREWMNILTGEVLRPHLDGGQELWNARDIFATLPVAALVVREDADRSGSDASEPGRASRAIADRRGPARDG